MKTLHATENTPKAELESWLLDRIIAHEEFVIPFTAPARVQEIVLKSGVAFCRKLSSVDHMYWMNVMRSDIGVCFAPVRIDA